MPLSTTLRRCDIHSQDILPRLLTFHVTGRSSKFLEALYQPRLLTMDTSPGRDLTETALTTARRLPGARRRQSKSRHSSSFLFFMPPARNAVVRAINRRQVHDTPHYRHWT